MDFEEERAEDKLTNEERNQDGLAVEMRQDVCKHFLLGRCHFGDRCRMSHSGLDAPHLTLPEKEGASITEKQSKNCKNDQKCHAEKKSSKKKPRMRTADDVICRIIWDSTVDPADFVVGHLDRFLGVLERRFSDFSWDAQVCDCDFSEELALPRHRIQYFSYKGQRVWDRDSRIDHVFGSTGQTILPPFGDVCQQTDDLSCETKLKDPANKADVSTQPELSSEQSEKLCDVKAPSHSQESEESSCTRNIEEGTSDGIVQKESILSGAEHSTRDFQKEEQEEAVDVLKDDPELKSITLPEQSPKRPQPRRPTHFICFRVDSPAALQAFQRIQRKVMSLLPQSEELWVNPATLHVTLSLLVLSGPEEVSAAAQLFQDIVQSFFKPPICVTFTPKLKQFNGTVLHVVPQPLTEVQSLNSPLQEAFKERGWLHRHSKCPSYHLTLAKGHVSTSGKIFEGIGGVRLAKDVNFGKLEVNKLYLCRMGLSETGFYQIVCAVELPNV
ncbi:hypothetical protein DNTS_017869 [Danionella cerebrum]|uniref:C3H1-type domain-containing protein n=1 Tax=Danionella cerebrum TaxID=2873325 RepID=A0A553N217_9TELE|nr:hypothetical protein DNTS_017869 [Danionella translucida]